LVARFGLLRAVVLTAASDVIANSRPTRLVDLTGGNRDVRDKPLIPHRLSRAAYYTTSGILQRVFLPFVV